MSEAGQTVWESALLSFTEPGTTAATSPEAGTGRRWSHSNSVSPVAAPHRQVRLEVHNCHTSRALKVITNKSSCERNVHLTNSTTSSTTQRISIPSSGVDLLWRKSAEESLKFLSPADTAHSPYHGWPCLAPLSPFRRRITPSLALVATCTGPEFGPAVPVPTHAMPSGSLQAGGGAGVGCAWNWGQPSSASTSYVNFNRGILTWSCWAVCLVSCCD